MRAASASPQCVPRVRANVGLLQCCPPGHTQKAGQVEEPGEAEEEEEAEEERSSQDASNLDEYPTPTPFMQGVGGGPTSLLDDEDLEETF